jgi:hypothetical protein
MWFWKRLTFLGLAGAAVHFQIIYYCIFLLNERVIYSYRHINYINEVVCEVADSLTIFLDF